MAAKEPICQSLYMSRLGEGETLADAMGREGPLRLRLRMEDRIRAVAEISTRPSGDPEHPTETMRASEALALRDEVLAAKGASVWRGHRDLWPDDGAAADAVVAAFVEAAAARGYAVPDAASDEVSGRDFDALARDGVVRVSGLDCAMASSEVAVTLAGCDAVHVVVGLLGSERDGARDGGTHLGCATMDRELALGVAENVASGRSPWASVPGRFGSPAASFFPLVTPADVCGVSLLAPFLDADGWRRIREGVCGSASLLGDFPGRGDRRVSLWSDFSAGALQRVGGTVRRVVGVAAPEAVGRIDLLQGSMEATMERCRHSAALGAAALAELDALGVGFTLSFDGATAQARDAFDHLRIEAKLDDPALGSSSVRVMSTSYGASPEAPSELREQLAAVDRSSEVGRIRDGAATWRLAEDEPHTAENLRSTKPSPDLVATDVKAMMRVFCGHPADYTVTDADGRVWLQRNPRDGSLAGAADTDEFSRRVRAQGPGRFRDPSLPDGRRRMGSIAVRATQDSTVKIYVNPEPVPAGLKVSSPGPNRSRPVADVDRGTALRELGFMVEAAKEALVDRLCLPALAACASTGGAFRAWDGDEEVSSLQRQLLKVVSEGASWDGAGFDPEEAAGFPLLGPHSTPQERAGACAKAARIWADGRVGGPTFGDGFRIDPVRVAAWAAGPGGPITCRQKIRELVRQARLAPEDIVSDDPRQAYDELEALVAFDEESARAAAEVDPDSLEGVCLSAVAEACRAVGAEVRRLAIDRHGVISYTVRSPQGTVVTGTVGQVPATDGRGIMRTGYVGRPDIEFVGGWRGRYLRSAKSAVPAWERIQLTSFAESMAAGVRRCVTRQTLAGRTGRSAAGAAEAAVCHGERALNRLVRSLIEERRAPGELESMAAHGHDLDVLVAQGRNTVRFPRQLREQAGYGALKKIGERSGRSWSADRMSDGLSLTGGDCIRVVGFDGMFCDSALNVTSDAQGVVRVLGKGVEVDADGHPVPVLDTDGNPVQTPSPLADDANHAPVLDCSTADRMAMTLSNVEGAIWSNQRATMALLPLGGLTMEDAWVVSRAFAESHPVPTEDGETRPLHAGDKLCDKAGNKGVISFVADPDADLSSLSPSKADACRLFAANPHLDVAASPHSFLSRMNGGTLVQMLEHPQDLLMPAPLAAAADAFGDVPYAVGPDGSPEVGADGVAVVDEEKLSRRLERWLASEDRVVELPVDGPGGSPLRIRVGSGLTAEEAAGARSLILASARAAAAEGAVSAGGRGPVSRRRLRIEAEAARDRVWAVLADLEAAGLSPEATAGEAVAVAGGCGEVLVDITDKTTDEKTSVYDSERGEGRNSSGQLLWIVDGFGLKALERELFANDRGFKRIQARAQAMGVRISDDGEISRIESVGDLSGRPMRLPAPLAAGRSKVRVDGTLAMDENAAREAACALLSGPGGYIDLPFPVDFGTEPDGAPRCVPKAGGRYYVPVIGAAWRGATVDADGSEHMEDVTRNYVGLIVAAMGYEHHGAWARIHEARGETEAAAACARLQESYRARGRACARSIADDVAETMCAGTKNEFLERLLKRRIEGSATCVWIPDPDLDVDQVALAPEVAENAGVTDGDHVLVWRDPILRRGGIRYLEVKVDEGLDGCISVSPVIAQSMDGDFDGDSVAVVPVRTPAAQRECEAALTCAAEGVRLDVSLPLDDDGLRPVFFNNGSDVRLGAHLDPQAASALSEARAMANAGDPGFVAAESAAVRRCLRATSLTPEAVVIVSDPKGCFESIYRTTVAPGVKGSVGKIRDLAAYMGYDLSMDEDGKVTSIKVDPFLCRDGAKTRGSQLSTATKSEAVGLGGAKHKVGIAAMRGGDIEATNECFRAPTQSLLQAKHDAEVASFRYDLIGDPTNEVIAGRGVECVTDGRGNPHWVAANTGQMDPKEWADMAYGFFCGPDGHNLPMERSIFDRVARGLATDGPDGRPVMADITRHGLADHMGPSVIDWLAYHPNAGGLKQLAADDAVHNLFDGLEAIQPDSVRELREASGRGAVTVADARARFAELHDRAPQPRFSRGAQGRFQAIPEEAEEEAERDDGLAL